MKITIENTIDGFTHRAIVESSGVTASEVLEECINAMLGIGFQEDSVRYALLELGETYEEIQDKTTE